MAKSENNSNDDRATNRLVRKFQEDFIKGALTFITVAAMIRGDQRDSETIFNEMMNPIIGNRNRDRTGFEEIMPSIYEKIISYCNEAIELSQQRENKELNNG